MAPQELKIYIPHGLCAVNMISVFPRSKTAYLIIPKKSTESEEKNDIKGNKIMKSPEWSVNPNKI